MGQFDPPLMSRQNVLFFAEQKSHPSPIAPSISKTTFLSVFSSSKNIVMTPAAYLTLN
jgi:hypothetical protein